MSNLKVHGYKHITFWQEDGIGVIAVRTDSSGRSNVNLLQELIMTFGTAVADDLVKAVALTGINHNFLSGLLWFEESQGFEDTVDMSHTLVNIIAEMKKPVFALLNGDAIDYGYELALLSDYIIALDGVRVGFNDGYLFMAGGSLTWNRYSRLGIGPVEERVNADTVIGTEKDFLDEAKKIVMANSSFDFPSIRKLRLANISSAIHVETEKLLRSYYSGKNEEKQKAESGENQ